MKELQRIYTQHNKKRLGHTEYKEVRGALFKEAVGQGNKVLDVGCRDGTLTAFFLENNEVKGLDIDSEALKLCPFKTKKIDLNSDWMESGYQVVVMGEVLEHLYFPTDVLINCSRALESGGKLIGSVPNAFAWRFRLKYILGRKDKTPLSDPTHINHFSKKELTELLKKVFTNVHVKSIGGTTLFFTAEKK